MMSDDAVIALRKYGASESEINDFSSSIVYDWILNEEELISVFEHERERILARRSGIPALQPDDDKAIPRRPSYQSGPDAQTLLERFLARFGDELEWRRRIQTPAAAVEVEVHERIELVLRQWNLYVGFKFCSAADKRRSLFKGNRFLRRFGAKRLLRPTPAVSPSTRRTACNRCSKDFG